MRKILIFVHVVLTKTIESLTLWRKTISASQDGTGHLKSHLQGLSPTTLSGMGRTAPPTPHAARSILLRISSKS